MKVESIPNSVLAPMIATKSRSRISLALSGISIVSVLIAWYLLTASFGGHPPFIKPLKLPSPAMVFLSAASLGWVFWGYCLSTLMRVVFGLLIGCSVGVILGLALSTSRTLDAILSPILGAIRPVPIVALTPWVILWMGLGDGPQIFMVALGALMVMATSTYSLASNAETRYILAAKSMGVDSVFMQTGIILPLIFPSLFAALRVAVAICFGIAVAAEYLGAQGGLGFLIRNARTTLNTETILLGIFAIGIEAWLVDWVVQLWAKAYSVWQDTSLSREQS